MSLQALLSDLSVRDVVMAEGAIKLSDKLVADVFRWAKTEIEKARTAFLSKTGGKYWRSPHGEIVWKFSQEIGKSFSTDGGYRFEVKVDHLSQDDTVGGVWHPKLKTLLISVGPQYTTDDLLNAIEHELVHVLQSEMRAGLEKAGLSGDEAGLPRRRIRNDAVSQATLGISPKRSEFVKTHSLDDIEFYPMLQSAKREYFQVMDRLDKQGLDVAGGQFPRKAFLALVGAAGGSGSAEDEFDSLTARRFFVTLRKENLAKWKRAVSILSSDLKVKGVGRG